MVHPLCVRWRINVCRFSDISPWWPKRPPPIRPSPTPPKKTRTQHTIYCIIQLEQGAKGVVCVLMLFLFSRRKWLRDDVLAMASHIMWVTPDVLYCEILTSTFIYFSALVENVQNVGGVEPTLATKSLSPNGSKQTQCVVKSLFDRYMSWFPYFFSFYARGNWR